MGSNYKTRTVYTCEVCHSHYFEEDRAQQCCSICKWEGCTAKARPGAQGFCDRHWRANQDRREAAALEKAELVGDVAVSPESPICLGDTWLYEEEYLIEHLLDTYTSVDDVPEFCFAVRWCPLRVNLSDMVSNVTEGDAPEDVEDYGELPEHIWRDLGKLGEDINAYWESTNQGCWHIDYKKKLRLRAVFAEHFKPEDDDE